MKIGKLYQVKKFYWLLYPSKERAVAARSAVANLRLTVDMAFLDAPYWSDYFSKKFNCNVSYVSPETILFPIEIDGEYVKVLASTGELGWIIDPTNQYSKKGCIEEIAQE